MSISISRRELGKTERHHLYGQVSTGRKACSPLVDFGASIRKGKTCGAVVVRPDIMGSEQTFCTTIRSRPALPRRLLNIIASGFQRCHVPVHKDNILAGFGRTRVKIVVIEKERSRSRKKHQDEVRNSAGRVPLLQ